MQEPKIFCGYLSSCAELYSPDRTVMYGFGYVIVRSPYTPYSIYLSGTIPSTLNPIYQAEWRRSAQKFSSLKELLGGL